MLVTVAEYGGWNFGIPRHRILRGWNGAGKGVEHQEQLGGLILEKWRLRENLLHPCNSLTGGWGQVGLGSAPRKQGTE